MKTIMSQCAKRVNVCEPVSSRTVTGAPEAPDKALNRARTTTDSFEAPDAGLTKLRMARTITEAREAPDKAITSRKI